MCSKHAENVVDWMHGGGMHTVFVVLAPLSKTRMSRKLIMEVHYLKIFFPDLILQMCKKTRRV